MVLYTVRGITVNFPFEAYPCQLVYMEKVMTALQTVWLWSRDTGSCCGCPYHLTLSGDGLRHSHRMPFWSLPQARERHCACSVPCWHGGRGRTSSLGRHCRVPHLNAARGNVGSPSPLPLFLCVYGSRVMGLCRARRPLPRLSETRALQQSQKSTPAGAFGDDQGSW